MLVKQMKRDIDKSGMVAAFVAVPIVVLLCSSLIPGWADFMFLVLMPAVVLSEEVCAQWPGITDALGSAVLLIYYGTTPFQYLCYALVVASAIQQNRLRTVLLLMAFVHGIIVATAVGVNFSWGFDMTPADGSSFLLVP